MKKKFTTIFLSFFVLTSLFGFHKMLEEKDINELYNNHIKPHLNEEYRTRYVPLPMHKNKSFWPWEGKDFPRVIAVLEFERFINSHSITSQKALAINGASDPEWHYLPTQKIVTTSYDLDPIKHNLYSLDLEDKDFDFVMVNQTFEHIYDPIGCLQNIYDHMQEGAILYFNVPANSIPHWTPFHFYTGFTPSGVGAIVQAVGFKILSIGQWGNIEYIKKMFSENDWPDYRQFKNPGYNDFSCPVIIWVFALK